MGRNEKKEKTWCQSRAKVEPKQSKWNRNGAETQIKCSKNAAEIQQKYNFKDQYCITKI